MNTTVMLDAELLARAEKLTGIRDHSQLVKLALEALVNDDRASGSSNGAASLYHTPRRQHFDPHIYDTD